MMTRLRAGTDTALLQATEENLHAFSVKGLRTLVVGSKVCCALQMLSCARTCCACTCPCCCHGARSSRMLHYTPAC